MTGRPNQHPNLKIFESDDGYIIYHRQTDRVHFLNHTAVFLLELCDGKHSIPDMVELLVKGYGLDQSPEQQVVETINNFVQEGLVISSG